MTRSSGICAAQVAEHLADGQPVVSVDTKKKELVGEFENGGREYQPAGQTHQVSVHDFPDKDLGRAIPYGIYDVSANTGWVTVGTDHDTSAFAVATLRSWWQTIGSVRYRKAVRLLICADSGGSNGNRIRAWKIELAKFATETGLQITVCHLPPGTSAFRQVTWPIDVHEFWPRAARCAACWCAVSSSAAARCTQLMACCRLSVSACTVWAVSGSGARVSTRSRPAWCSCSSQWASWLSSWAACR